MRPRWRLRCYQLTAAGVGVIWKSVEVQNTQAMPMPCFKTNNYPGKGVQIKILRAILTGWSKIKEKKGIVFFRCDIF